MVRLAYCLVEDFDINSLKVEIAGIGCCFLVFVSKVVIRLRFEKIENEKETPCIFIYTSSGLFLNMPPQVHVVTIIHLTLIPCKSFLKVVLHLTDMFSQVNWAPTCDHNTNPLVHKFTIMSY